MRSEFESMEDYWQTKLEVNERDSWGYAPFLVGMKIQIQPRIAFVNILSDISLHFFKYAHIYAHMYKLRSSVACL